MCIIASKFAHRYTVPMNKTNNNEHVICKLYNMKLHAQKKVKSNPKQPSCKKSVWHPKNAVVKKRCEIQSGGQEMAVIVG